MIKLLFAMALATSASAQPIVIAHRGASGYLPEHTLEAKAMAHAMGAHYLEQDIVLTKDDVPVVMHDIHLDTISNVAERFPDRKRADGRYYALDFTLAELKQLTATERFSEKTGQQVFPKRFPKGKSAFVIPTLEEELQFIQGLNQSTGRVAGIYPEIKQPQWHRSEGHDISKVVLPILQRYGYATKTDPCFLQCFELEEVQRIRQELGWQGRLIMLISGGDKGKDGTDFKHLRSDAGLASLAKLVDGIGPPINDVLVDLAGRAHTAGLQVHPYTLRIDELPKGMKTPDEVMNLLFNQAKVEGVFTDFPDVALRWLQARSAAP